MSSTADFVKDALMIIGALVYYVTSSIYLASKLSVDYSLALM